MTAWPRPGRRGKNNTTQKSPPLSSPAFAESKPRTAKGSRYSPVEGQILRSFCCVHISSFCTVYSCPSTAEMKAVEHSVTFRAANMDCLQT